MRSGPESGAGVARGSDGWQQRSLNASGADALSSVRQLIDPFIFTEIIAARQLSARFNNDINSDINYSINSNH